MPQNRAFTEADYRTLRPMINLPASVTKRSPDERPVCTFSLLTYNILAQDHIYRNSYPYCGKDTLRWKHRREVLAAELAAYDADIVCFQEMDRFHDYFQPLLSKLGYDARYIMRNGPNSDVNCIGWKRARFKLVESKQVSFEGSTAGMGAVPNVAQLCALEDRLDERMRFAIATTHLYWRMEYDHIRLAQLHTLTKELLQFCEDLKAEHEGDTPFIPIIAGDLNSDYESIAVLAALRTDFLMSPEHFNEMLKKSQMSEVALRTILSDFTINWPRFYDAHADYASIFPGDNGYPLPYTSFSLYKGVLDHILYMQYPNGNLRIVPVALRQLPDRHVLEVETALPNKMFASDHLALNVDFAIFHNHS